MTWYLLILFASGAQVVAVPSKAICEQLKAEIINSYGRGSGLSDVRCTSVLDSSGGRK